MRFLHTVAATLWLLLTFGAVISTTSVELTDSLVLGSVLLASGYGLLACGSLSQVIAGKATAAGMLISSIGAVLVTVEYAVNLTDHSSEAMRSLSIAMFAALAAVNMTGAAVGWNNDD